MILKRFYDEKLAQASYLIGCAATGDAVVVDPCRDIDPYLRAAEAEGLEIRHVTETHIHADFVSGLREVVARTGATAYLSNEGGPDWSYEFADAIGARLVGDGDSFMVGNIRLDVMHTPGHTPEHLTFLVTDTAGADRPIGALTGDFVFVGDVGRPDLLEKAAGVSGTMEAGARDLFRSLERFREFPDWLQIWPGHGAGSACGKGLSSIPHSTLGYEKLFNWGLSKETEEEFVAAVLDGQPEPPKYFAEMKRINREGPPVLHGFPEPDIGTLSRLREELDAGAWVVDTRSAAEYAIGHIPGTANIPLNRSFNTWAGWILPYDRDVYLIVDQAHVAEAIQDLAMIGLDRVAAVFAPTVVETWAEAGGELGTVKTRTPGETEAALLAASATVLDVRGSAEWREGHIEGVDVIPTGHLLDRLDELPRDGELILHCRSAARSAIAASLLQRAGFDNVSHMQGGWLAWTARGLPAVHEDAGVGAGA
jgi:hydroxyacylglutathione hydrolase